MKKGVFVVKLERLATWMVLWLGEVMRDLYLGVAAVRRRQGSRRGAVRAQRDPPRAEHRVTTSLEKEQQP